MARVWHIFRKFFLKKNSLAWHQIKKNEVREAKQIDISGNVRVFCMGLQAVLLSPKSNWLIIKSQ